MKFVRQVLVDFTARDFQNLDEKEWTVDTEAHAAQNNLKERLQKHVPENVFTYQARWTGDGITTDHIDKLCEDVFSSLERIILDEIEHPHEIAAAKEDVVHIRPDEALDERRASPIISLPKSACAFLWGARRCWRKSPII